jgi:Skp family chaperone for outer membrane proteins
MVATRRRLCSPRLVASVISIALFVGAGQSGAEVAPKGIDKVLKRAEDVFAQISRAQTQLKSTLEACRKIIEAKSKASPDRLKDSIKDSQKQVDELDRAVKDMEDDSTDYFTKWERSILDLDESERGASEAMRTESWDSFRKVSDDAADSENELRPLLEDLERLVAKLDHQTDSSSGNETELAELERKAGAWSSDVDRRQKNAKQAIQELSNR